MKDFWKFMWMLFITIGVIHLSWNQYKIKKSQLKTKDAILNILNREEGQLNREIKMIKFVDSIHSGAPKG